MEQIPTAESYVQKVIRIAKELDISIDMAAVTCDGFEMAFSDENSRRAIFGMIEQLDESAATNGEPSGLIINYAVEVGLEGIRVSRYADEVPPGEIVELTPPDQACIFLRISDDFPTQEVLGPMIVNKPRSVSEPRAAAAGVVASANCPAEHDGLTGREVIESKIPAELPSEWSDAPICLGPIRPKLNERFPFLSAAVSRSQPGFVLRSAYRAALDPLHHLPSWAPLQTGMPALQWASGLSPPFTSENLGHSDRKMFLRHWQ